MTFVSAVHRSPLSRLWHTHEQFFSLHVAQLSRLHDNDFIGLLSGSRCVAGLHSCKTSRCMFVFIHASTMRPISIAERT